MIFEKQDHQQNCLENISKILQKFNFKKQDNLKECLETFYKTTPLPVQNIGDKLKLDVFKLYQCEDCLYLIDCDKEVLDFLRDTQNEYIFIDGFEDLSLENFLNLNSSLNDRLRIVY